MLAEKEKAFLDYWEKERKRKVSFLENVLNGLPMAAMFSAPVLLLVLAVYLFFPEWYTRISNSLSGAFLTVLIAIFLSMFFFAYFRMQFKRETNEQIYLELLAKAKKEQAANSSEM